MKALVVFLVAGFFAVAPKSVVAASGLSGNAGFIHADLFAVAPNPVGAVGILRRSGTESDRIVGPTVASGRICPE